VWPVAAIWQAPTVQHVIVGLSLTLFIEHFASNSASARVLESLFREMKTSTEIFEGLAKQLHVINSFIRDGYKTIWRLQQEAIPQVVVLTYVLEFTHSWLSSRNLTPHLKRFSTNYSNSALAALDADR
jgi:hypothetical protein